jgi:alpha-1,3-mannosyltransferase
MKGKKGLDILHVGNHTFPCVGGIESVIWNLAHSQSKQGNHVRILVFNTCTDNRTRLPSRETHDGVSITRIPFTGPKFYRRPSKKEVLMHVSSADVVHVHGFGPWIDILSSSRNEFSGKLFLTTHGGFLHTQKRKWLKKIYAYFSLPSVVRHTDGFVFVSDSDKEHFPTISPAKSAMIPNGAVFSSAKVNAKSRAKSVDSLFVGRLSSNKRIDRLLDAFSYVVRTLPSARLHIVGEDWEGLREKLEEKTVELNLSENVTFHGRISDAEMEKLNASSVLTVSASEHEGFGIGIVEGMGAGLIPFVSDIPAFRALVGANRGVCVDFAHAERAGNGWAAMLKKNTSARSKISKEVQAFARKEFDWDTVSKRTLDFYESTHREAYS